ncbi:MAG: protein kinase [Anaerolineales bacterium]|nr:protein kinase [Anaerolineales bacterium]
MHPTSVINGRYQLQTKLGAGGMGIVYRATDRLTGETVALKQVTTPEKLHVSMTQSLALTPSQLRLALAQEFQTLAGLRHPHIISVLDYGFDAGQQPFFTMDYLPAAETILAAGQAQPVARRIELLQQLLQALAYLHRRGVLHRDLKPGNVLVCRGAVKVLDFGLAASTRSGSSLSGGTPLYLAPEVWEATAYTPAADLWAVGVMGVELLAGHHPFGPLDGDLTSRVLDDAPDLAGVPEAVRPVLARLLDKDPVARYGRAADVLAELAAALGQEAPAETTAIRESYLQAATFVGREAEMAQLEAALLGALAGRGSAWLIGGESGVGKTRLLDELRTRALVQGFQVLRGQMREDGSLPYEAWREPVRHLAATLPEMDALAASVLLPLVPDIGELVGSTVSPAPELEGAAAQTRLFTTVATLLRQANRPLLILMEDLQWAKESLYPIPFITRTIKDQPVVLIGSYRNDEQPALPERLADMQLLSLPRLTTQEMAELSRAMLGEIGQQENVLTLIQQETEGNAFFAVEVVRALAEDVGKLRAIGQRPLPEQLLPGGIQAIIERRLERIPAAAWPLLQLAAVAGRELDLKLVEAFAGAVDVPAWWLPLCSNAAVLEVRNGRWQFSHDKIRRSVLMALPAAARAAHHGQIAEAITAVYPDSPEMAAPIAHHWQAAGNNEQERHYRLAAANYAQEQFAYDDLLAQLDRALILTADSDLAAQFDILAKKVKALYFLGKTEQEENAAKQLISLAEKTHDAEKIVVAHTARVQSLITKGDLDTANRIAQDTMGRFVDQPVDSLTGLFPVWAMCAIMQGYSDHALSILD